MQRDGRRRFRFGRVPRIRSGREQPPSVPPCEGGRVLGASRPGVALRLTPGYSRGPRRGSDGLAPLRSRLACPQACACGSDLAAP